MKRRLYLIILISILLISTLFTGCSSSHQKKKSVFSEEQTAELRDILDRNMTDQDWEKLQQAWDRIEKLTNQDSDIDVRNDYDKDPMVFMSLLQISSDNPNLQKELTAFSMKLLQGMKSSQGMTEEKVDKKVKEQLEKSFK